MSGINAIETKVNDPLLYLAPLPYVARFYPYGIPVDVASDRREVIDAAYVSWGSYAQRFDRPPIRFHVMVSEGSGVMPRSPVLRGQRNILVWVSDHENFAVCDHRQRFGYACVTSTTVADQVFFRWHYLEAIVYVLLELTCFTSLHAACVARNGAGILLFGESGMGKSTLTYACARQGWTYVSDDASSVLWDAGRMVIGEPHHFRFRAEAPELFPELRGRTVGREMERKPTIEVHTAGLPIQTASECRVEHIVFLDRDPAHRAGLTRIDREEVKERLRQDMPVFDPELEPRRLQAIHTILEAPGYVMRYPDFEEAIPLLERLVAGGQA